MPFWRFLDSFNMPAAERERAAAEQALLAIIAPFLGPIIESGRYDTVYRSVQENEGERYRYGEHIHVLPVDSGGAKIIYSKYRQDRTWNNNHDETTYVVELSPDPRRVKQVRSLEHSRVIHGDLEGAPTVPVRDSHLPAQALSAEAAIFREITRLLPKG